MNQVTEALAALISDNRDTIGPSGISINSVLSEIGQKLRNVWDYEPEVIQDADCPCICLGLPEMGPKEWIAAPYTIQSRWAVPIIAYIVYDDDLNNARAIKRLFKAIERLFEDLRFMDIPIQPDFSIDPVAQEEIFSKDATILQYLGEPPIVSGRIEFEEVGEGLFLRKAELDWVGYEIRQIAAGY